MTWRMSFWLYLCYLIDIVDIWTRSDLKQITYHIWRDFHFIFFRFFPQYKPIVRFLVLWSANGICITFSYKTAERIKKKLRCNLWYIWNISYSHSFVGTCNTNQPESYIVHYGMKNPIPYTVIIKNERIYHNFCTFLSCNFLSISLVQFKAFKICEIQWLLEA